MEIKDPVFDVRGNIGQDKLTQLHIRGADTNVDDALMRHGWDGKTLVAVPIVTTEPDTGKVLGSRWELRGPLAQYSIKATSIWAEASKNISLSLDFKADQFRFSARPTGTSTETLYCILYITGCPKL